MALFGDSKTDQMQFALMQEMLDALFIGVIVVNEEHKIIYANKAIASKVNYEQGWLIGREIHELLPPNFREKHREILEQFFANPYHVAIEQRQGNIENMNLVPRGTENNSSKWLPARIGIHPIFVDPTQQVFQTETLVPRLKFGLAEISFAGTFN